MKNRFLFNHFRLINLIFNRKRLILTIFRKLKLHKLSKRFMHLNKQIIKNRNIIDIVGKINDNLLRMNIVEKRLSPTVISGLVDFHSPTAKGYRYDKGININKIFRKHIPNFKIEHFETYNHLSKATNLNKFTKVYDIVLRKIFPKTGATFFVILKKFRDFSN